MIYLVDILSQIPTSLVSRAKPIIDIMLVSKSLLRWNDDLELVIKDDVVPDTNVPELIVHALIPIDKEQAPSGFSEFVQALGILGLDSQYVENEYARQILEGSDSSSSSSSSSDSDTDSDTDSSDDEKEIENQDNEDLEGDDEENLNDETEELEDGEENGVLEIDDNNEIDVNEIDNVDELETQDQNDELEIDDDAELEEKPEVEWLQVDNENGDNDIYINSTGYYKRV